MDIRITPATGTISVTGSAVFVGSGSAGNETILAVDGNNGRLFEVSDDLSGTLFSVNTIAGLPVIEACSNNTVILGEFNQNNLIVSGSKVGINTATLSHTLSVNGAVSASCFIGNGSALTGISSLIGITNDFSTALGIGALTTNPLSTANAAVGINALRNNTTGYRNIALGTCSLVNNTTGMRNAALGFQALYCNTTGRDNIAIGELAGINIVGGSRNVGIGRYALRSVTAGNNNVSVGAYSSRLNTASGNTVVGAIAFECNTTGNCNTALGYQALRRNTNSSFNTAVGNKALCCNTTNSFNTAVGALALQYNPSGYANTAIGYSSMLVSQGGRDNIAIGRSSLQVNTGTYNITLGTYSMRANTSGSCNIALGFRALRCNTTGTRNIALGFDALCNTVTSNDNIAVGIESGFWINSPYNVSIGARALRGESPGNRITGGRNVAIGQGTMAYAVGCNLYNVAIGRGALSGYGSRLCNIAIGAFANSNATCTNMIAIGNSTSTSNVAHHTVWGNDQNNVCNCVFAAWSTVSDCRDKTDIQTLPDNLGLNLIKKLRPVSFKWDHRSTYERECKYEYGQKDGTLASTKNHYGLIAQELKQALDELGAKFDGLGHDEEKDAYRVTYEELIAPLIKSIQELDIRITALENK